MKKILAVAFICLSMVATSLDAMAAKRFGGGMSFGRSAPAFVQKQPASSPNFMNRSSSAQQQSTAARSANTAKPQNRSMLGGLLGGLAAGLGIAALLSMLGIHSGFLANILTMVLILAVGFFLLRWWASRQVAQRAGAQGAYPQEPEVVQEPAPSAQPTMRTMQESAASGAAGSVMSEFMKGESASSVEDYTPDVTPADFDKAGFLATASTNYKVLQEAWASGDIMRISEFTGDDLFVEITHQLRERKNVKYTVEVKTVDAQLRGIAQTDGKYVAVVEFKADMVIDGENELANELWILEKPVEGNEGWLLTGIHQVEQSA